MLKTLTKLMKVSMKKKGKRHLHVGTQHSDKIVCLATSKGIEKRSSTCNSCIQTCQSKITSSTCNFYNEVNNM
jgi:hypothetical protein